MGDIISLLFFIFLLQALVPFLGRRILEFRRGSRSRPWSESGQAG